MLAALATGVLLGLSCGLAPGPLLALVLAQTLRHGAREGCKVAFAPLLTDSPIILLTAFLALKATEVSLWVGLLSVAGGLFVLYLAWDTFRAPMLISGVEPGPPQSWLKGSLTNLLSPHPWLFWLTVGAATLAKAFATSWQAAAAFLAGFYLLLIGSKVFLALLAARTRTFLTGRPYRIAMRLLALVLAVFASLLVLEGAKKLAG